MDYHIEILKRGELHYARLVGRYMKIVHEESSYSKDSAIRSLLLGLDRDILVGMLGGYISAQLAEQELAEGPFLPKSFTMQFKIDNVNHTWFAEYNFLPREDKKTKREGRVIGSGKTITEAIENLFTTTVKFPDFLKTYKAQLLNIGFAGCTDDLHRHYRGTIERAYLEEHYDGKSPREYGITGK